MEPKMQNETDNSEKQGDLAALEEKLHYTFRNRELLKTALTHSSYVNEKRGKGTVLECNERLEFLGDAVLSAVVSEHIYKSYPELPEGELSRIRAGSVCERALGGYANAIGLGGYIYMGKGEEHTNGRKRASLLSDAFEAVLAAMYLDGGYEPVIAFVMPFASEEIKRIFKSGHTADYKTMLQQFIQHEHGETLEYALVDESGPPHNRSFSVEARMDSNIIGRGKGRTKREAEQKAAYEALKLFGIKV